MSLEVEYMGLDCKIRSAKFSKKALKVALDECVSSLEHHFTYDKWDLDAEVIRDEVLYNLLGFDLNLLIDSYIMKTSGVNKVHLEDGDVFCLGGGYEEVFYDTHKDRIFSAKFKKRKNCLMDKRFVRLGEL